jgi:hypothetical protein
MNRARRIKNSVAQRYLEIGTSNRETTVRWARWVIIKVILQNPTQPRSRMASTRQIRITTQKPMGLFILSRLILVVAYQKEFQPTR